MKHHPPIFRNGVITRIKREIKNENRPTPAQRGYDHRWRKSSEWVRAKHPICQDCQRAPSEEVHHVVKKRDGGSDHAENLIALCKPCHSRRTARGE